MTHEEQIKELEDENAELHEQIDAKDSQIGSLLEELGDAIELLKEIKKMAS